MTFHSKRKRRREAELTHRALECVQVGRLEAGQWKRMGDRESVNVTECGALGAARSSGAIGLDLLMGTALTLVTPYLQGPPLFRSVALHPGSVFERFRAILHEGAISKRVQVRVASGGRACTGGGCTPGPWGREREIVVCGAAA